MNKNTWWVPVSSFVLAVTLALVAGPKNRLQARAEGGATGGAACVCDLRNLRGESEIAALFKGEIFYDINCGIPGDDSTTVTSHDASINYVITVKGPGGVPVKKPLDVPMIPKPPLRFDRHFGVRRTNAINVTFTQNHAVVEAALRAARHRSGYIDDNWDSPVMAFHLKARTNDLAGLTCKDEIKLQYEIPLDLLGGGSAGGFEPD